MFLSISNEMIANTKIFFFVNLKTKEDGHSGENTVHVLGHVTVVIRLEVGLV